MTKKTNSVPKEQTKWFKRGFASKHEYIGWLQFNDLVEESFGYDDTYHDPYSGKTFRMEDLSDTDSFEDDNEENIK